MDAPAEGSEVPDTLALYEEVEYCRVCKTNVPYSSFLKHLTKCVRAARLRRAAELDIPADIAELLVETTAGGVGAVWGENSADLIVPRLFLGAHNCMRDEAFLEHVGPVELIVNVAHNAPVSPELASITKHYQIADHHTTDLGPVLEPATAAIHEVLQSQGGVVLVHCVQGVSRSASVVIAYLIRYHDCSLAEALRRVRAARSIAYPNVGFLRQLMAWEATYRPGQAPSLEARHLEIHAGVLKT